ncbi:MAG: hypothetical protein QW323_04065 [Candidatus Bathyarchaeia archaeon]
MSKRSPKGTQRLSMYLTSRSRELLFVSSRYYPHVGGVEYVVKSVAEGLIRRARRCRALVVS